MSAAPKTYTQKFTVYRHDGDHLGNVKPGALLRYAQQIATTHAEAAGLTDEVYTATRTAFVWPNWLCILTAHPAWTKS